jgi:hypothetical protein
VRRALPALLCLALPFSAGAYTFIARDGCPDGRGVSWPARLLPSQWSLNETGYPGDGGLPTDVVQQSLAQALHAWEEPCCSAFRSAYAGTTAATALSNTDPPNVVSFRMSRWSELGLGVSTIAVTWPQWTSGCELVGADILFNADGFHFHTDGTDTDLQAIATHEFGHWLGLGHTSARGATMVATYLGGILQRSLEKDDQDGVCALYPATCRECNADADCASEETCTPEGACRPAVRCDSSDTCPAGSACVDGGCHPGCRDRSGCPEGEQCLNGSCRSECSICAACTADTDCGAHGYRCLDLGGGPRCTEFCTTDADCDGNSVCRAFAGHRLCTSDSASGFCGGNGSCVLITGCPGLWLDCRAGCAAGAGRCIADRGGTDRCTCSCTTAADCGVSAVCNAGVCIPEREFDPCFGVTCGKDETCSGGSCVPRDPCAGIVCPRGQVCRTDGSGAGACASVCGTCPEGTRCNADTASCEPVHRCDGVRCADGLVCDEDTGTCVDACEKVSCPGDTVCVAGSCVDPCADVTCGDGAHCDSGTCVAEGCTCPVGERCRVGSCVPLHAVRFVGCSGAAGPAGLLALPLLLLLRRRRD